MDLLRQVALRFPTEELFQSGLVDNHLLYDWIRQRTGFSDARLLSYLEKFGYSTGAEKFRAPFYLAGYMGSPIPEALDKLTGRMVLARWAFLQRPELYIKLKNDPIDLDTALMSGIPQIQIHALENAKDKFDVIDPEIIPWTSEVVAYYSNLLKTMSIHEHNRATVSLAGYLQIDILSRIYFRSQRDVYIRNYALAEMQKSPDRFTANPKIDHLLEDESDIHDICFYAGYFPPYFLNSKKPLIESAISNVWPELVRRLSIVEDYNLDESRIIVFLDIRHGLVARAREMLGVLDELDFGRSSQRLGKIETQGGALVAQRLGETQGGALVAQLRALCGLPVDPIWQRDAEYIMVTTAHPQVTAHMIESIFFEPPCSVHYDLVHFLRIVSQHPQLFGLSVRRKLTLLYAQGRLLDAYDPDDLQVLRSRLRAV